MLPQLRLGEEMYQQPAAYRSRAGLKGYFPDLQGGYQV